MSSQRHPWRLHHEIQTSSSPALTDRLDCHAKCRRRGLRDRRQKAVLAIFCRTRSWRYVYRTTLCPKVAMLSCLKRGLCESIPDRTWRLTREIGMPWESTSILLPADPQQRITRQVSSADDTTSWPWPPPSTSTNAVRQASASRGWTMSLSITILAQV